MILLRSFGCVSTGGWWWRQTQALILGSLPLKADSRLTEVDRNILTNMHKLWFRSSYLYKGMTRSGMVTTHPILAACCMDLMHQRLYTETSFSTDDRKVCKFSNFQQ